MHQPPTRYYYEHITPSLKLISELTKIHYVGDTKYQHVEILETQPFGRQLVLDGRTQSSEADEFVYHESLVQPGMAAVDNPRTVFIAGGGEGATLREVLSHKSVQRVTMVDLDKEVVDLCKQYLPRHHQGAFDDPRLTPCCTKTRASIWKTTRTSTISSLLIFQTRWKPARPTCCTPTSSTGWCAAA